MKHIHYAVALPAALACTFLLSTTPDARQRDAVVDRVIEIGRKDPQVMDHLSYLSEHIGPRLTGSPALNHAGEWAVAKFASFGLEARLEQWGEFPVGFDRGPSSGGMVAPTRVDYVFGTNAWTAGTPGPVRGPAVLSPKTIEELDAMRDRLPGAWVVEGARSERPARDVREQVDAALAAAGIAGRIGGTGPLVLTSGNYRISFDELPTDVSIQLKDEFYDDLKARLDRGEDVELEFDIDNRFLPGPMPQYNVIADLVGSEFPDEYVYVGGHLDTWDGAQGAQDNGTGCSTAIEAARMLTLAGAGRRGGPSGVARQDQLRARARWRNELPVGDRGSQGPGGAAAHRVRTAPDPRLGHALRGARERGPQHRRRQ